MTDNWVPQGAKKPVRFKQMIKSYMKRSSFQAPVLWSLLIGLLFITALGVRVYHIDDPPMDFHPTRQYHSAVMARGYYFEASGSAPEWKRELAILNERREGVIEPPIVEVVAFLAYRVLGGEYLWIPRLLSSVFWLIGGAFVYLIAKKISSPGAAVLSAAFYLFLPYGILASRSFQPDPLMVMTLLLSIFTVVSYYEQPSNYRLIIAAVAAALALMIKPGICFFQIFAAFISIGIYEQGARSFLISKRLMAFIFLSLLPVGIYYLYGTFFSEFLQGQVQAKIMPRFLVQPTFWALWLKQVMDVVGGTYFIGALLGVLMLPKGLPRALLAGLWSGYAMFGLVFTYHIHTHDYYQLQLVPVVALSLGPVGALIWARLSQIDGRWYRRAAPLGVVLLAGVITVLGGVAAILQAEVRNPNAGDFENKVRMYEEIGGIVDHSPSTLFSAPDYGLPLKYHGWLSGVAWPNKYDVQLEQLQGRSEVSVEERFDTLEQEYSPDYFIIVRDFWSFEEQQSLRAFLGQRFPMIAEDDDYWVFELREKS